MFSLQEFVSYVSAGAASLIAVLVLTDGIRQLQNFLFHVWRQIRLVTVSGNKFIEINAEVVVESHQNREGDFFGLPAS